ncbi:MAG TPA: class I SAM-dependent methyltransferase [Dehalococcoidia bacterium]|nr:class I SAM-dependent methyltransferase [Dehalococcoidia bacterium]
MTALYDTLGLNYSQWRRPDARIAEAIHAALGDARSVVNVGAGTGSYEPADRDVTSVEPSPVMVAQRPADVAPAVRAVAEALPFAADSFDASLAVLTLHHWPDWRAGAAELKRVARGRAVVFTHDWAATSFLDFWLLRDYLPSLVEAGSKGAPPIDELCALLGGSAEVVPVPADCADGFLSAYWQRPEVYLDEAARAAISAFHWIPDDLRESGVQRLEADLASGAWADRNANLLDLDALDLGYRLIVADV